MGIIGLYRGICLQIGIEFLEVDTIWKLPIGCIRFVKYFPRLCLDAIAYNTRVRNDGIDLSYNGFDYSLKVEKGEALSGTKIRSVDNKIKLSFKN